MAKFAAATKAHARYLSAGVQPWQRSVPIIKEELAQAR
jgi:hypothetical protein